MHGPKFIIGDLNSRLYHRLPDEEDIIGPYVFQNDIMKLRADMNRFLLLETYEACNLIVANSFLDRTDEKKVTYREWGVSPLAAIRSDQFTELDIVLIDRARFSHIIDISSHRDRNFSFATFPSDS